MIHKLSRAKCAAMLLAGIGIAHPSTLKASDIQLTDVDVGFPSLAGSMSVSNNATGGKVYTIVGGGADIWGTADAFNYAYMSVTGDFDYVIQIRDLQGPDGWTKAEFMARVDDGSGAPQPGDPFIANMATRPAGQNQIAPQIRAVRDGNCDWTSPTGTPRPVFPGTWFRMERLGNVFYQYYGTNGVNWKLYEPFGGTIDTAGSTPPGDAGIVFSEAWPNKILLGLAVTAHNDSDATGATAVFSDFAPHVTVPIQITTQPPATKTFSANTPLELSVSATGDPLHYQWRKNGTDIPGATASTYRIALASTSDSGTYSVRLFGAGTNVISANSAVTVIVDTIAPTITSVSSSPTFTKVRVAYSEPVGASAENKANYALDNGASVTGVTRVDDFTVALVTSKMADNTSYTLTVNNVQDSVGNPILANTKISFMSYVWVPNVVLQKYWEALGANSIASLTNDVRFPNKPTSTTLEPLFEYPPNGASSLADSYGNQLVAWFMPPETGDYVFFLCSDDYATLYLSPDADPDNAVAIATETAWSNPRQWVTSGGSSDLSSKRSDEYSNTQWASGATISLTKNTRYYIQALHSEGTGGDNVGVTFKLANADDPVEGNASALTGSNVGLLLDPTGSTIKITKQPKDTTVAQNTTASFESEATGSWIYGTNVAYQWQTASAGSSTFTNITGATKAAYTTGLLAMSDSGRQFRVVASVPTLATTSSVAKVTINSDVTPPTAIAAGAVHGSTRVGVQFSELLDLASAQTAANYQVNGIAVTAAILHFNKYVELQVPTALNAAFTVSVKNVKDLAGNSVVNTTLNGTISAMTSVDVGTPDTDPLQPGYSIAFGNDAYLVAGGGSDIWGTADACQFLYQEFTGPFDLRVRVEAMNPMGSNVWAKVELMARESTDPGSRHSSVCATRADGQNLVDPQYRDTTGGSATDNAAAEITPIPYPNCWLRLVRESATSGEVKFYFSNDGSNWTLKNTHTTPATDPDPAFPAKLLLGLAVTSHDNTGTDVLAEAMCQSFSVKTYTPTVDPQLKVSLSGGKVVVSWASGTLVSSPTVNGSYTAVTGAASPYSITPVAGASVFYRVQE